MTNCVQDMSSMYMIADLPERDRPRERLAQFGADVMTDSDLLAILLRSGPRGCSTIDLARQLLAHFDGRLDQLALAEVNELRKVKGIGPAKAAEMKACFTLARRLAQRVEPANQKLNAASLVAEYLYDIYHGMKQEEVRVILLDTRNQLISNRLVTRGTLTASQVHPREVFRPAIREAAARIILAHNHPSGDPSPSKQDIEVTKTVYDAGEIIGIPLVDHVIVGSKADHGQAYYTSLRQLGHCG